MNEMKEIQPMAKKQSNKNKKQIESNKEIDAPKLDYSDFSEMEEVPLVENQEKPVEVKIVREGRISDTETNKPYKVIIVGFNSDKVRRDGEPARFCFTEDITRFETYNLANEYMNSQNFVDSLKTCKMFEYMVKRFNNNLPFFSLMQVIIKHDVGTIPCYYPGKEIEVSGFFNKHHFSSDFIDIAPTKNKENE